MNSRELDRIEASYAAIINHPQADVNGMRVLAHNIPLLIQEVRRLQCVIVNGQLDARNRFAPDYGQNQSQDTPRLDADRSGPLTRTGVVVGRALLFACSAGFAGYVAYLVARGLGWVR